MVLTVLWLVRPIAVSASPRQAGRGFIRPAVKEESRRAGSPGPKEGGTTEMSGVLPPFAQGEKALVIIAPWGAVVNRQAYLPRMKAER